MSADDERGDENERKLNGVENGLLKYLNKKQIIRACSYDETNEKYAVKITNTGRW